MHLHIVSFNVPYPADYGGVIDVFYRIKTLYEAGVKVHLHCYTYGRAVALELERYCVEVNYYKRETTLKHALQRRPYIVDSRCSNELLERLMDDNYPILLEGIHCCWLLEQLRQKRTPFADEQKHRIIMVRAHNVEHEYYQRLAAVEKRFLRRCYLKNDARKLQRYEPILQEADAVLTVTEADAEHFRQLGCKQVLLMPSSHHHNTLQCKIGKGDYALYQADLSVAENIAAVKFLITHVFAKTPYRFVIAGRNPGKALYQMASKYERVTLVANPTDEYMDRMIADAQVNIMVTQQPTGLKLKLLHALYCGRHCLVNQHMVAGTKLGPLCSIADDADHLIEQLKKLMTTDFTEQDISKRRQILANSYSNENNARKLIDLVTHLTHN